MNYEQFFRGALGAGGVPCPLGRLKAWLAIWPC